MSESIKTLIQKINTNDFKLVQGIVISDSPMRIKLVNDNAMVVPEQLLIIPKHLSKYTQNIVITMSGIAGFTETSNSVDTDDSEILITSEDGGGATREITIDLVDGVTNTHSHGLDTHSHTVETHKHTVKGHKHDIKNLSISKKTATIEVDNSLKVNDYVHLISINRGRYFYVLDKVG